MGAKTSKFGSIAITLDEPYFVAGDYVRGQVHLDCKETFFASQLLLVIDGKQFAQVQEKGKPMQFVNVIYASYMILHQFPNRQVLRGQYSFPFSFVLQSHLPGTFNIDIDQKDYAHIKYILKAQITSLNKQVELKHNTQLIVRQVNKKNIKPSVHTSQIQTSSFCCVSAGRAVIKAELDQNIYVSGNSVNIKCSIDNTQNASNFSIVAQLVQIVALNAYQNSPFLFRDVISIVELPVYKKRLASTFQVKIPLIDKKKKLLEPSSNGKIINCKYQIQISPTFSACCSSQHANSFILPFTIQGQGGVITVQAPNDWKPQMFESQMLLIPKKNKDSFIRRQGVNPYIQIMQEDPFNNYQQ